MVKQGLALYPKGSDLMLGNLGRAYLMLGDNDAAIEWGLKLADVNPELFINHAYLAMAYSNKGDTTNAAIYAAEYRRRATVAGSKGIDAEVLSPGTPAAYVKYWNERYVPEWKKAGLP